MDIPFAALADEANTTADGKLNIFGIFDTIWAKQFPTRHPNMVFAFRIRFESEDQKRMHRLRVRLLDQDGAILFNADAQIQVGEIPAGEFIHGNQVIRLSGAEFRAPGRYRLRIEVKGLDRPYDTVFQVLRRQ